MENVILKIAKKSLHSCIATSLIFGLSVTLSSQAFGKRGGVVVETLKPNIGEMKPIETIRTNPKYPELATKVEALVTSKKNSNSPINSSSVTAAINSGVTSYMSYQKSDQTKISAAKKLNILIESQVSVASRLIYLLSELARIEKLNKSIVPQNVNEALSTIRGIILSIIYEEFSEGTEVENAISIVDTMARNLQQSCSDTCTVQNISSSFDVTFDQAYKNGTIEIPEEAKSLLETAKKAAAKKALKENCIVTEAKAEKDQSVEDNAISGNKYSDR